MAAGTERERPCEVEPQTRSPFVGQLEPAGRLVGTVLLGACEGVVLVLDRTLPGPGEARRSTIRIGLVRAETEPAKMTEFGRDLEPDAGARHVVEFRRHDDANPEDVALPVDGGSSARVG